MTGNVEQAELCYKATRRAGTTVLIGQPTENAMAGFPPYWIAQDENRVIGSSYGSTRPMIDFPKALRLVKHGLLDLEGLVSEVWPFERINEAIALVETGRVNRMVLNFPGTELKFATETTQKQGRNVMKNLTQINRRHFLKGTAAATAAVGIAPLPSCAPPTANSAS